MKLTGTHSHYRYQLHEGDNEWEEARHIDICKFRESMSTGQFGVLNLLQSALMEWLLDMRKEAVGEVILQGWGEVSFCSLFLLLLAPPYVYLFPLLAPPYV